VSFVLATLWEIAEHELRGVGDAALGEWREVGDVAVHLRRRLTDHEMRVGAIADVCDVRHTDEHVRRIERVRPFLPLSMQGIPADHLL
jgi:hypothetical protein